MKRPAPADLFHVDDTRYSISIEIGVTHDGAWVARSYVWRDLGDDVVSSEVTEPVAAFRSGPDLSVHYAASNARGWAIRAARTIEHDTDLRNHGLLPAPPDLLNDPAYNPIEALFARAEEEDNVLDMSRRFGQGSHEGGDDAH